MSESIRKLFFAVLAQFPLLGGLWAKWDFVRQHPVLSASLGVGYEALVFGGAFLKKVWEDELKKDAIKATADWIRAIPRKYKPGFQKDYYQQVIREYGVFNVRGLGIINTYTLKLDQVFVDLRISNAANPNQKSIVLSASEKLSGNRQIWDFLRYANTELPTALAIIGEPGCGKTTLLQHIALTMAGNRQRQHKLRAYVPLLLFLRDHAAAILEKPALTLEELAQTDIPKKFPKLKPPVNWFQRQLDNGKCLVLLDGLDEVAEKSKREAVSQWVDRQIKNYPRCHFIVSSRPHGYQEAPLQNANVIKVQNFNFEQVKRFVQGWYLANEIVASGNVNNEEVRERATKDANDLLKRLTQVPALNDLTVNPLLLTMIAMVHRYQGALPGSRGELYNHICDVLLGRWRQSKGIQDNLTIAQKRAVLQPLAAAMMKRRIREIPVHEANEIIGPILKTVGIDEAATKTALQDFQTSSGLLQEREVGIWSFAHLTFQEYLTAAHCIEKKEEVPDWQTIIEDSWWHETLRLYAMQADATNILTACLAKNSTSALMLAADCLEEAKIISEPAIRMATNERLITALESAEQGLRKRAAEVQLQRRLTSQPWHRLDETRFIDQHLLSCAEYQLFLDEMRAQGQYHQPDHWVTWQFPTGQAQKPILGMRAEDAQAFCDWLTQRQGEQEVFRLPQPDEIEQAGQATNESSVWCLGDERYSVDGLKGQEQKIAEAIKAQIKTDLPFAKEVITETRALARARDLALARDRADNEFDKISKLIESNQLRKAQQAVAVLKDSSTIFVSRFAHLIDALLGMNLAADFPQYRLANRQYTAHLLAYAYSGYDLLKSSDRTWWQKLRGAKSDYAAEQQTVLQAYWWLQILLLREAGKLPAWEGIRMVRERKPV